ncbi:MAG: cytochrome c3 family protein [Chromatiaceae bacterium]|nr:cytochrome c3 family protein [Gammaproteobacteria bacterium]MCP5409726.1 cytochrome c3 family protein [Chromatiaceae bacterium]
MVYPENYNKPTRLLLLVTVIWLGTVGVAMAEKVTLSPDNWGVAEGKACIDCHKKSSSGLTRQWEESAHAEAGVNCLDCHQAVAADDDAMEHEGAVIATIVSPKDCGRCHTTESKETQSSVHSQAIALIGSKIPGLGESLSGKALVSAGCTQCHGSIVEVRGDGTLAPESWPNSGIGRLNPDGSRGSCSACHGRHQFSKAEARTPEACTWCHSGSDSPDGEVYAGSKHGVLFTAHRDKMNFDSDQWVTGKDYSAAPTCVTCHMGASPGLKASHDVGMREAWSLNGPVSEKQYLVIFEDGDRRELPATQSAPRRGSDLSKLDGTYGKVKAVATPKRRRQAMSKVCVECHSKGFTSGFMRQFDDAMKHYNESFGKPAQSIMLALYEKGLLTTTAFDEPLEFTYWQLWHDEGTKFRHGAAMASPGHTSWEGIHKVAQLYYGSFLPQVREVAGEETAKSLIDEYTTDQEKQNDTGTPSAPVPLVGYGAGKP